MTKILAKFSEKTAENVLQCGGRSEHESRPVRNLPRKLRLPFRAHHTHFCIEKIHDFPPPCRNMATVELHQILTQKLNVQLAFGWTSLNIARATKNWLCNLYANLIKYCACPRTVFFFHSTIPFFYYSFASAVLLVLRFFLAMILWLYSTICFALLFFELLLFDATILWLYYAFYSIFDSGNIVSYNLSEISQPKLPLIVSKKVMATNYWQRNRKTLHFRPSPAWQLGVNRPPGRGYARSDRERRSGKGGSIRSGTLGINRRRKLEKHRSPNRGPRWKLSMKGGENCEMFHGGSERKRRPV